MRYGPSRFSSIFRASSCNEAIAEGNIWLYYDPEVDTLYVNFKKPSVATDSELTDDDVLIRYEGEEVIGYTILHASQWQRSEQ